MLFGIPILICMLWTSKLLLRSSSTRKSVPGQWRWRQKKFRPVLFFLDRGGLLNITAPPYASARHQTGKSTHARYAVHLYHTCRELPTSRHDNQAVEWSGFTGEHSSLCCFPCLGQPSPITFPTFLRDFVLVGTISSVLKCGASSFFGSWLRATHWSRVS